MATELYNRQDHPDRGPGLLVLTRCSNGVGRGTRLELYASTGDDDVIEIRTSEEAEELALALMSWARPEGTYCPACARPARWPCPTRKIAP